MIGIYLIKCKANDKNYIGQSLNIKHRINEHKCELRKNRHSNSHLQNAFNKYCEEQFEFKVLYEMPKEEYTKEKLNQKATVVDLFQTKPHNNFLEKDIQLADLFKKGSKGKNMNSMAGFILFLKLQKSVV